MSKKQIAIIVILLGSMVSLYSCEKLSPEAPAEDEILDGPVAGLTHSQSAQFLQGDNAFNARIFTESSGLGSVFVASSCGSCHAGDGKGHPFTTLTRFGQVDSSGNQFLHLGGPQLQNKALPGFTPEQIPAGATFSKFTPPAVSGLGYLSFVSDVDILALADAFDANGDGISGVPNWIDLPSYVIPSNNSQTQGGNYIGRFGKKAAAYSLLHQTVNAYNQDMGITSLYNPFDVLSGLEIDPEVSTQNVNDVVFYLQTLKAPIQRNQNDSEVKKGASVFTQINCSGCHTPSLKTGISSISGLSNQTFYPYTDLLLHDMGTALDDGYTEGNALTSEWKTPPLWGLGLSPNSQGGQYYLMHDGRAKSIEEAILLHGGEAFNSKTAYQNLSESDKNALLKFLKSL